MNQLLAMILLIPFILWSSLQGILYTNYGMVEETLNLAVYEGQKEASLNGRYTEEIYSDIRSYLVDSHNYDPSKIEIEGTESRTPRGEFIYIEITIPRPMTSLLGIFTPRNDSEMTIRKEIMSEYIP